MFDKAKVAVMAEFTFKGGDEATQITLRDLEVAGKSVMWVFRAVGQYVNETSMFDSQDEAVDYYNFKHNHLARVYGK